MTDGLLYDVLQTRYSKAVDGYIAHLAQGGASDPDTEKELSIQESVLKALEGRGWISVDDKLPELNQDVIVWRRDYAAVLYYGSFSRFVGFGYLDSRGYWQKAHDVTHWMPIPEVPKKGKR